MDDDWGVLPAGEALGDEIERLRSDLLKLEGLCRGTAFEPFEHDEFRARLADLRRAVRGMAAHIQA